jgi:hypothetical protein
MARDRNVTVWQAYVIVMSIVSFLSLGWLCYILFTSGTNQQTAEKAIKDKDAAVQNLRKASDKNQILLSMLGIGTTISKQEFEQLRTQLTGDKDLDEAAKAYTSHMVLFGQDEPDRNYVKLIDNLTKTLRRRNETVAKMQADRDTDQASYKRKIDEETKLRESAQQEKADVAKKAQEDLETYNAKIAEQVKLYEDIQGEMAKQQATYARTVDGLKKKMDELIKEKTEQEVRIASLNRKLAEVRNEGFEYVQGRIADVKDQFVWISLGKSQGLRPGVSFSVMDSDVSQVTNSKVKARIEVVEVISSNMSRCKIIEDRAFTPILKGDTIYSPLWQPNVPTEIALVGKMDIDGDGRDDRERLKTLIQQNGATVVLELAPGQRLRSEDALTQQIRWLVLGDEVKVRTGEVGENMDPAIKQALQDRQKIESKAKALGITIINLNKMMNFLQATDNSRTLGADFRPSVNEYLPKVSNPYQNGRVSELYQAPDGRLNPKLKPE